MKLQDVDLYKLLPGFMKEDVFNKLLADGTSNLFKEMSTQAERAVIYGHIDELTEAELDQLATDMGIFWYLDIATIDAKRQLIKDAPLVFSRLGTVWAVERVMNQYLANTELQEWFDYDGDPHYFRFKTNDTAILKSDIILFLSVLERIKRKSQWLELIILELLAMGDLYPWAGFIDSSIDTYSFIYSKYLLKKNIHHVLTKAEMQALTKNKYCEVGTNE